MDVTIDRTDQSTVMHVPQPGNGDPKKPDVGISLDKPAPPPAPARVPPPSQSLASRPRPLPARAAFRPTPSTREMEDTFAHFANPNKRRPADDSDDDDDDDDSGGGGGGGADHDRATGGDDGGSEDSEDDSEIDGGGEDDGEAYSVDEPEDEATLKPSEGFATIDEEKASLIFKLARAKKAGMPSSRTFSMHDDVREMRAEMARINHELDLDASLRFQRKMLMMFVSTSEFLNRRYDPFQFQLDGWTENVHDSINDYDKVFERLHEKYKSKMQMAPEIELLMMVGGSALMFHMTQTMFKRSIPGLKSNPELMTGMLSALNKATMGPKPAPAPAPAPAPGAGSGTNAGQRREMRGPQFDMGSMMGGLGAGFQPPPFPQSTNTTDPKKVAFAPEVARPAPNPNTRKRRGPPMDDSDSDDDSSRMSDVPSDDDLSSIPDDLTSVGGDDLIIPAGGRGGRGGRGRGGGGRGSKAQKTIITL